MATVLPRVVVVGGGFAGFHAARRLRRVLRDRAELTLVSPTDYLLYSRLLPEVATGTLDPRDIAVPLRQALRGVRQVAGHVLSVDTAGRTLQVGGRDGEPRTLGWDRLVLAPGSVIREFAIPGVPENARGLKTLQEAMFLRNWLLAQLDQAEALPDTEAGRAERRERLTVVAVGAGYTGSEFVAQAQHWVRGIASRWSGLDPDEVRWLLVDVAAQDLPELGPRLGASALRERGVEVRLGVSVSATGTGVHLTDGSVVPTRTLVWSAGVAPSPLVATLGLPLTHGRLVVDADLSVPGIEHVWAAGAAAAEGQDRHLVAAGPVPEQGGGDADLHVVGVGPDGQHPLAAALGPGHRRRRGVEQGSRLHRFQHEVGRPRPQRADRRPDRRVRGHQHGRQPGRARPQSLGQLQTGHPGHLDVGHQQVERLGADPPQRLQRVVEHDHLVAAATQHQRVVAGGVLVVVHDQDAPAVPRPDRQQRPHRSPSVGAAPAGSSARRRASRSSLRNGLSTKSSAPIRSPRFRSVSWACADSSSTGSLRSAAPRTRASTSQPSMTGRPTSSTSTSGSSSSTAASPEAPSVRSSAVSPPRDSSSSRSRPMSGSSSTISTRALTGPPAGRGPAAAARPWCPGPAR